MTDIRRPPPSLAKSALLTYREAVLRERKRLQGELQSCDDDLAWVDALLARVPAREGEPC